MTYIYRKGATGALLDEYERAIADLLLVIAPISDEQLTVITDPHTADENCRSVQTILSHVVNSGFGYATSIHNLKGHNRAWPEKTFHLTIHEYAEDLAKVLQFTVYILGEFEDEELEEQNNALKITAHWGQLYDPEQMMEHAIVHILRHRRQIQRIKEQAGW